MSPATFHQLLFKLTPRISKTDAQMRKAIDAETRLCVTLLHLATYALGRKTVADIIQDTCEAMWDVLAPIYLATPQCHDDWRKIAKT